MLRICVAIIFWSLFSQVCWSQGSESSDTKDKVNWAKVGVIHAIYAYMEDYKSVKGSLSTKEGTGMVNYHKKFLVNTDFSDTSEVDSLFKSIDDFLKIENNGWQECHEHIYQPMKQYIKDSASILSLSTLFDLDREYKDTNVHITHVADKLGNDQNKRLRWKMVKDSIWVTSNLGKSQIGTLNWNNVKNYFLKKSDGVENDESIQQSEGTEVGGSDGNSNGVNILQVSLWLGLFLVGFILSSLVFTSFSTRRVKKSLGADYKKYLRKFNSKESNINNPFDFLNVVQVLADEKKRLESKLSDAKNEIAGLKEKPAINKSKEKSSTVVAKRTEPKESRKEISRNQERESVRETSNSAEPNKTESLYFKIPEPDGTFKISEADFAQENHHYYKIEHKIGDSTGQLYYLSSTWDLQAINGQDSYLNPVCDVENWDSTSAKKVQQIAPGKVVLRNNTWTIDPGNKVKVKLY